MVFESLCVQKQKNPREGFSFLWAQSFMFARRLFVDTHKLLVRGSAEGF